MTVKYLQIPQKVRTILSQEKCKSASNAKTANKLGIYKICIIIFTLLLTCIILIYLFLQFKNFNHIEGKIILSIYLLIFSSSLLY